MEPADTWIGRAMRRREDPRLLIGRGCYAADHNPPGLVHIAVAWLHTRVDARRMVAHGANLADLHAQTDGEMPFGLDENVSAGSLMPKAEVDEFARFVGFED